MEKRLDLARQVIHARNLYVFALDIYPRVHDARRDLITIIIIFIAITYETAA